MWNICQAQCPVMDLFNNHHTPSWSKSSLPFRALPEVTPGTARAQTTTTTSQLATVINEQPNRSNNQSSDKMADNESRTEPQLTEYKRQFQWSLPMVEPKPVKAEPIMTQYQLAYGCNGSTSSSIRSPTTTYSRQSSSNDQTTESSKAMNRDTLVELGLIPPAAKPSPVRSSAVLFSYEPPPRSPSPLDIPKQSEYHAKFKPFNEYVYVEGLGFKKQAALTAIQRAKLSKSWITEVEERSRQACKYRARSRNVNADQPQWDGTTVKDRNLQALALATQLIIEEKKQERKTRSASVKPSARNVSRNQTTPPVVARETAPRPVPRQRPVAPNSASSTASTGSSAVDRNNNNVRKVAPKSKPAPVVAVAKAAPTTASAPSGGEKKWIKPKKTPVEQISNTTTNGQKEAAAAAVVATAVVATKEFTTEPKSIPLRITEVKSPEQISGIKSPSPESWKVSIEKGGLNWVNGNTPVNFDGKCAQADSMVRPVAINATANDDLYGPLSA